MTITLHHHPADRWTPWHVCGPGGELIAALSSRVAALVWIESRGLKLEDDQ